MPRIRWRKYNFNQSFFETIDTEQKAYFLGFLYSDGNVSKRSACIRLRLKKSDSEILHKLSKVIDYDGHLVEELNTFGLILSSEKMKGDLIKIGCVPAKSLILEFPSLIPENLLHHFIRGYFDGDGCIYLRTKEEYGEFRATISIVSTNNFLIRVAEFLSKFGISTKISGGTNLEKRGNFVTKYLHVRGRRNVEKFLNVIYKDSTIFLKRKHDKKEQFFHILNTRVMYQSDKRVIRRGKDSPMYGYKFSEEMKKWFSESRKGVSQVKLKVPVVQLDMNGNFIRKWDGMADVTKEKKINHGKICMVCKNKRKSAGGFRWVYLEEYEKMSKICQ